MNKLAISNFEERRVAKNSRSLDRTTTIYECITMNNLLMPRTNIQLNNDWRRRRELMLVTNYCLSHPILPTHPVNRYLTPVCKSPDFDRWPPTRNQANEKSLPGVNERRFTVAAIAYVHHATRTVPSVMRWVYTRTDAGRRVRANTVPWGTPLGPILWKPSTVYSTPCSVNTRV